MDLINVYFKIAGCLLKDLKRIPLIYTKCLLGIVIDPKVNRVKSYVKNYIN
jgi:hypothetical protein